MNIKNPEWIRQSLEYAWLNLSPEEVAEITNNPLKRTNLESNPVKDILRLMRKPENFHWTCKHLLSMDIPPIQSVILQEMWRRPFPMLIGSRGLGKCLNGSTRIISNQGMMKIEDLVGEIEVGRKKYLPNVKILGEKGFINLDYCWNNGLTESIKVTTRHGFEIETTTNHPLRCVENGNIVWKEAKDIKLSDYIVLDRTSVWPDIDDNNITEDMAYVFGLLIGDGGYTVRGAISYTTADIELLNSVNKVYNELYNKQFEPTKNHPYDYRIHGVKIWDDLFQKYGFNSSVCAEKDLPSWIWKCSKTKAAALLSGLYDTDGGVEKGSGCVSFCSKSKNLVKNIHFLLSRFGIIARTKKRLNTKYNTYYYYIHIQGENCRIFEKKIGFRLKRKQEDLKNYCYKESNTNLDILPHQLVLDRLISLRNKYAKIRDSQSHGYNYERQLLSTCRIKKYQVSYITLNKILELTKNKLSNDEDWIFLKNVYDQHYFYDTVKVLESNSCITYDMHLKEDHSFISNGFISHNSTLLAMYAILRATLCQGIKIVIVGSGFRQAKYVFDYAVTIWRNSPALRELVGAAFDLEQGPKIHTDRCTMLLGTSKITALPIGDGCVTPYTLMTYGERFGTIADYHNGEPIVSINNTVWSANDHKFLQSDYGYFNGLAKTKKIFTETGFIIEGTYNHKLRVLDQSLNLIWKRLDEITEDDYLPIDRSYRWHNGDFQCTPDQAYVLGLMIGDGSWVDKYKMQFTTPDKDTELVDSISRILGFKFKSTDNLHYHHYSVKDLKNWLEYWGLNVNYGKDKVLPRSILSTKRECMSACLRGLFDTDGTLQINTAKGGTGIAISFCNVSKILIYQMQYILLHYSIVSTVSSRWRKRKGNWNIVYELFIHGQDVLKFYKEIGFGLKRKQDLLEFGIKNKKRWITNSDVIPYVKDKMIEVSNDYYSSNSRIGPRRIAVKKVITRDYIDKFKESYSKYEDNRIDDIIKVANRDIFYDKVKLIMSHKELTYDLHIPETNEYCAGGFFSHNSKIRGERANIVMADEFASQNKEIFETVIAGFGVVQSNPIKNMQRFARIEKMRELGVDKDYIEGLESEVKSNQTIISGTADFSFGHFCAYWRRWKSIIESRGDKKRLAEIGIEDDVDWRDYSIIRIPVDLIPGGYFDAKQIARSKATQTIGIYKNEFGAVFSDDSIGFFPMSLIHSCEAAENVDRSQFPKDFEVFNPVLIGSPDLQYVYGIDPASQRDNFSIQILELRKNHCRIVYGWSTKASIYKEKVNKGLVKHTTFYGYTARKIRDLMKVFPCAGIAMDSQGGGHAVMEALNDPQNIEDGELPIWEIIDPDKEKPSDDLHGLHIVELVQFSSGEYTGQANHGLKKDMEDKVLLFPETNAIVLAISEHEDNMDGRIYDTLEDCIYEIEELKNELVTITHIKVGVTGRDRWDTPETKLAGGKKGRMHKDRYSALLMGNALARRIMRTPIKEMKQMVGGFARKITKEQSGKLYIAPDWYNQQTKGQNTSCLGFVVKKGV